MAATGVFAFQPIPKESAKALGVTRAKPFSAGMLFVNGKYVEPPYTVERWGTGIRINAIPVTGQIVDWNEFLKTQPGVRLEKRDAAPKETPAAAPAASEPAPSAASATSSLDDLFDDDSSAEKKDEKPAAKPAATPVVRKSAAMSGPTAYVLDGAFKPNDASKALVKRINSVRTDIDKILRSGGFIFFGDKYSWVTGDKRTLLTMLETLPELQQNSHELNDFLAGVRTAKLVYLNEVLCEELFRNRLDYRKIKERRKRYLSDQKWSQVLEDAVDPVF